jgi:hypothetical protein
MLNHSKLISVIHYDQNTGIFTRLARPEISKAINTRYSGKITGHLTKYGYLVINIDHRLYLAHRLAWLYVYKEHPINNIDHINGIKTDNRILNLRLSTHSENGQNIKAQSKNNKCGLLGVSYDKSRNLYESKIMINRKSIHLGRFKCKHEAHEAYLKAKRELHPFCTI